MEWDDFFLRLEQISCLLSFFFMLSLCVVRFLPQIFQWEVYINERLDVFYRPWGIKKRLTIERNRDMHSLENVFSEGSDLNAR